MSTSWPISSRRSVPCIKKAKIELQEWHPKDYLLTEAQVGELLRLPGHLLEMQALPTGKTRLKARAIVGRICTRSLDILIRPKYPVPSLLLMLAEVHDLPALAHHYVGYQTSEEIVDLLVQVFLRQVDYITRLGVKRGYVSRQEDLVAIRGAINVHRSLALHLRGQPRVACSYEEYTLDVPENQLLLTALRAISSNHALPSVRRSLAHWLSEQFPGVRGIETARQRLSPVACDRLNSHYEPAIRMAHLILRSMGIESEFGDTGVSGFTLDMNRLFEGFIARRLQKLLRCDDVSVKLQQQYPFDEEKHAAVRPDLVFQSGRGCRVVADTKYKRDETPSQADLYQILAYCCVLKISCGVLITAATTGDLSYTVKDGATTIRVAPINLECTLGGIEEAVEKLAHEIRALLSQACLEV